MISFFSQPTANAPRKADWLRCAIHFHARCSSHGYRGDRQSKYPCAHRKRALVISSGLLLTQPARIRLGGLVPLSKPANHSGGLNDDEHGSLRQLEYREPAKYTRSRGFSLGRLPEYFRIPSCCLSARFLAVSSAWSRHNDRINSQVEGNELISSSKSQTYQLRKHTSLTEGVDA